VTLDEELVAALRDDYRKAGVAPSEMAMLDYVAQLTKDATRLTREDIRGLQAAGFDDRAILQITCLASWFNYINRMADALGLAR
jgi:uncharacterized peroxidase-related enzyme